MHRIEHNNRVPALKETPIQEFFRKKSNAETTIEAIDDFFNSRKDGLVAISGAAKQKKHQNNIHKDGDDNHHERTSYNDIHDLISEEVDETLIKNKEFHKHKFTKKLAEHLDRSDMDLLTKDNNYLEHETAERAKVMKDVAEHLVKYVYERLIDKGKEFKQSDLEDALKTGVVKG